MGMLEYPLSDVDFWLLGLAGTLFIALIGIITYRANARIIIIRKSHTDNVSKCVAPFKDAIANIHLGKHNHIFIMNSFFRSQEEAIAIFKSQCMRKNTTALQKVWDEYKKYYEENAKNKIPDQFGFVPEQIKTRDYEVLHNYLSDIIKKAEQT